MHARVVLGVGKGGVLSTVPTHNHLAGGSAEI